jgi:hypothetical protein
VFRLALDSAFAKGGGEFLVPYSCKTVRKNKKPKDEFDNCELGSISKALIPAACGLPGLEPTRIS